MPELPEVETMRRGLLPVVGARIANVQRVPCRCKPISIAPRIDVIRRKMVDQRISAVERVGKRVVLRLASQAALVLEPRMTGLVLLAEPPDVEHLRLRISLFESAVSELLFWDRRGLGTVRFVLPEQWDELYGLKRLGPDALKIEPDQLRQRLASSRRAIKVALLDQRAVAGIGNLYASEILNVARIHPERTCSRLSKRQWSQLHTAMRQVLEEAIRFEGSTLSDGTYRNALNAAGGYQNHHRVYDRLGQLCRTCQRGIVERFVQAQRSTFFCPVCQHGKKR